MEMRQDVLLGPYTSLKIGGPADFFVEVRLEEGFREALSWALEKGLAHLVLGTGSNVLIDDAGFRGLVILNRLVGIEFQEQSRVRALSGTLLDDVVEASVRNRLAGLVFASGIPGTIGGAVCGNAGAFGKAVGDVLLDARLMLPSGEAVTASRDELGFGYRHSCLKTREGLLVEARFQLERGDIAEMHRERRRALAQRRQKHPGPEVPSAGSFFKNVKRVDGEVVAAGRLLDQVGAKQLCVGDAAVYERHANILINKGAATSADVLCLASLLAQRVEQRFGIRLEREVRYIGPEGPTPRAI